MNDKAEIEQLRTRRVKTALKQTQAPRTPRPTSAKLEITWFGTYILVCSVLRPLLLWGQNLPCQDRLFYYFGACYWILLILPAVAIAKTFELSDKPLRIVLSVQSNASAESVVVLALHSLIIASPATWLQPSFPSLFSLILFCAADALTRLHWLDLPTSPTHRVGDRIQIGDAKGDVIDVSYLDTTLGNLEDLISPPSIPVGGSSDFPTHLY